MCFINFYQIHKLEQTSKLYVNKIENEGEWAVSKKWTSRVLVYRGKTFLAIAACPVLQKKDPHPVRRAKGWQFETGIHAGELREERRVIPYGTDSP